MTDGFSRGSASIEKSLALFIAVVEDEGATSLATLATRLGTPRATAQRMASAFLRAGLLSRVGRGRYGPGLTLARFAALDTRAVLAQVSRDLVRDAARKLGATVHLGVLENDMVTYVVKAHGGGPPVLTSELIQLEAYCTGIGKVLLAHRDPPSVDAYLAAGPFVALTTNTITEPDALRAELMQVIAQGYAVDDAELQDDLYCLAVPIYGPGGEVVAALSASNVGDSARDMACLKSLADCATRIGRGLGAVLEGGRRQDLFN
jgi:DNA-binding IclR family transcriptional regulator